MSGGQRFHMMVSCARARVQAYVMILAGYETTANALGCTLNLLAANPGAQDRLAAEGDAGLGASAHAGYQDLERMPYMDACLREGLRCDTLMQTLKRDPENENPKLQTLHWRPLPQSACHHPQHQRRWSYAGAYRLVQAVQKRDPQESWARCAGCSLPRRQSSGRPLATPRSAATPSARASGSAAPCTRCTATQSIGRHGTPQCSKVR